jgi:hypothetical protein
MHCRTTNQIDSSLAVIENGVLMFNCTCCHCGNRLVSMNSPDEMGMEKATDQGDRQ